MSYKRAEQILPGEIIELLQQYVEGESIYISRRKNTRTAWGANTTFRMEMNHRNKKIFADYREGSSISELAEKYYLSEKSIQRIIRNMK